MRADGTTIPDGGHELCVYKVSAHVKRFKDMTNSSVSMSQFGKVIYIKHEKCVSSRFPNTTKATFTAIRTPLSMLFCGKDFYRCLCGIQVKLPFGHTNAC